MSRFYYNGVLLPDIPTEISTDEYPYIWIRKNQSSGYYDLACATNIYYYTSSNSRINISSGTQRWYRIPIDTVVDDTTEWVFYTTISGSDYWGISTTQSILWSGFNIPNGSATSTDVYFSGSSAILENARLISVEKIEAETGTLTGSAVVTDRTDLSGNIVVDGIGSNATGTLTLNFTVPKSDYYVIRMYFTHNGTRDFKYVLNGKTYLQSVVGTSYYLIETIDFQMYLNEGANSVLFKGGTTTYAPMFDSFKILKISTNTIKYLVRNNDTIYTVADGSLVEVSGELNSNLFINNGVDNIPDGALLMTLSNPEVLCWTDSETLPTLTATVKGIPQPQVIVSEEINLMDGSIKGIESVAIDCKGEPVFAVSFDKKATWIMHNGTEWVAVSDKLAGMTKTEFEAITTEQWQAQYEVSSDMYIRCTLLYETQSITTVSIGFVN